ncbi:MAG: hypothetical protein ACI9R3_003401 [Verrucomicrobiales bacterium]|jgi:hypothetical protein
MPGDMPGGNDMPDLSSVPELGGLPEYSELPGASQIEAQSTTTSSLARRREVLRTELDKLSMAEQRQLRRALRQVWSNDKVVEAREAYRKAGQRYQRALHDAMFEQDTQVRPFLEHLIEAGLHVPLGKVAEAYVQVARIFKVPKRLLEPHKDEISEALTRAGRSPVVLGLRIQLEQTPANTDSRDILSQELRDVLRAELLDALPLLKDWMTENSELSA